MVQVLVLLSPNVKTRLLFEHDRLSLHVVQHLLSIITIQCIKNTCYLVWISKWQRVVWQLGSMKAKKKFNCAKIEFIFLIDCTQWRCNSRLKSHGKHCNSKWRDSIIELIRVWVLLVTFTDGHIYRTGIKNEKKVTMQLI